MTKKQKRVSLGLSLCGFIQKLTKQIILHEGTLVQFCKMKLFSARTQ